LKDVSSEKPEAVLDVLRGQDLDVFDGRFEVGRSIVESGHHAPRVLIPAPVVPRTLGELERTELREAQGDVFSLGCEIGFEDRRKYAFDVGMLGHAPVLRVVPRALEVFDRR
jgi:hypothetical protein